MKYRYDNRKTYDLKTACSEYGFIAPRSFWSTPNDELLKIWNGVGAEGEWVNKFIPETIYFVNISLASLPHDWCFANGTTPRHFHKANLYFLYNMNQIIRKHSDNELMKDLRYLRSNKYYIATESPAGYKAFMQGTANQITQEFRQHQIDRLLI
jgi:hypothetical protein